MKTSRTGATLLLLILFAFFTNLFLTSRLSEAGYTTFFLILVVCGLATFFSERVKEISLFGKAIIKLYQKTGEGLTMDKLALDVGKILAKLSEGSTGSAKQREVRERMIDALLKSAKASENAYWTTPSS